MDLTQTLRGAAIGGLAAITTACAPMVTRAEPTCDPYGVPGASYIQAGDTFSGEVAGRPFGYSATAQPGGMLVTFEHDGRSARFFVPSNVAVVEEYEGHRPNVSPDSEGVDRISIFAFGCYRVGADRVVGGRETLGPGGLEPVSELENGVVGGYLTARFGPGVNRLEGGR